MAQGQAERISQEESRKYARGWASLVSFLLIITMVDVLIYDLPILDSSLGDFLSSVLTGFIGFTLGISYLHGWPKKASDNYGLEPMTNDGRSE